MPITIKKLQNIISNYIYMNTDYINNIIIENTLNKFSYRPFAQNIEPYLSFSIYQYNICIKAWKDNNMKTFKDFLEWYNNLDVLPFIEAVEKMKDFYKLKRLDIFNDGVSYQEHANACR